MPRPRHCRRINFQPGIRYFKPVRVRMRDLEEIKLTFDELEAVRLKDYKNLDQRDAAGKMGISQPTFHRLLGVARKKITLALIEGKAIKIEGGDYKLDSKQI